MAPWLDSDVTLCGMTNSEHTQASNPAAERYTITFGRGTVRHASSNGRFADCGMGHNRMSVVPRDVVAGWVDVTCKSCIRQTIEPAAVPAAVRTHKGATKAVLRNLDREISMHHRAYESLPLDSLDVFSAAAARWLGDKSELKGATIERADWPEVYAYFCEQSGVEPAAPVVAEPAEVDAADVPVPVERDARWWDMATPAERAAAVEAERAADAAAWWEVTKPSTYLGRGFVMVVEAASELDAIVAACGSVGVALDDSHGMTGARVPAPVLSHATRTMPDAPGDVHYAACVCSWVGEFPHYDEVSATREAASHVTGALRDARIEASNAAINRHIEAERAAAVKAAEAEPAAAVACRMHGHDVPDDAAVCARCGAAVEVDPAPSAQPPVESATVAAIVATVAEVEAGDRAARSARARRAVVVEVDPAPAAVEHAALPEPAAPAVEHVGAGYRATDGVYRTVGYRLAEGALRAWDRGEFANIAADVEAEPAASRRAAITARVTRHHADFWRNRKAGTEQGARDALDLLDAAERELRELDASYPLDVRAYGVDVEHGRVVFVPNCHLFPGTHGYVTVEPDGHEQWHRDRYDAERWLVQRANIAAGRDA